MTLDSLYRQFPLLPLEKNIHAETHSDKVLELTSTIFATRTPLPPEVVKYVRDRQHLTFKPHETRFFTDSTKVQVIQKIPLDWGFQPNARNQIISFWHLVKRTRQILLDLLDQEEEEDPDEHE